MFKQIRHLKQELLFIPIMLLVVEFARNVIVHFYPETALFDRGSELESFLFRVWQITWITSASWLLMAVVFPPAFKALVKFYHDFDGMLQADKRTYATRLFLVFFFGLILLLSGRANTRTRLVDTLNSQLNVRELTGHNDGLEVERYLKFVGRSKGDSWCAAFTSYNYSAVGVQKPINPVSAWAPAFSTNYVIWSQAKVKQHKAIEPKPGDCFTLYYDQLHRVGHVGFIVATEGNYFITVEGNTGLYGSREGSGVHKLKRPRNKIYTISDYITAYEKTIDAFGCNSCHAALLLPPKNNYRAYVHRYKSARQPCYENRQHVVPGLAIKNKRRKDHNNWRCACRLDGQCANGHVETGNAQIKNYSLCERWQVESGLRMQGPGVTVENKKPIDQRLQESSRPESILENYSPDKGDPVYPLVG